MGAYFAGSFNDYLHSEFNFSNILLPCTNAFRIMLPGMMPFTSESE